MNFRAAKEIVLLTGSEQADRVKQMRLNTKRYAPESVRLAEGRLPVLREAYAILKAVAESDEIQTLINERVGDK